MTNSKPGNKTRTIIVLGMFSFLTSLAGSSVNLGLPQISSQLGISSGLSTWIVQSGLIGTTILLVLFGHLGDLLSKEYIFINGGLLFIIGSAINGVALSFWVLIAGRIVQSIGSAMIMANSMGIVSETFDDHSRAEALSLISVFVSVGSISGPAIGGLILSIASWRWIFLINVPVGLIILLFGCRALPIPKETWHEVRSKLRGANWTGQNLFTLGIIIFFLSSPFFTSTNRNFALGTAFLVVGIIITVYSFIQDDHAKNPWISPSVLRNSAFMVSVSALFLVMAVNAVSNILLPFYLQSFGRMSAFESGMLMMLQSVIMLMASPISGYFADRINRNILTMAGLIVLVISQIGYMMYPVTMNLTLIIIPIVINGIGMALFLSPNNAITMGTVDASLSGIAGSFNSFARTLGMTIGISMGSAMLFAQLPGVTRVSPALGAHFVHAFSNVFLAATFVSLVAFIIVWLRFNAGRKEARVKGTTN